MRLAAVVVLAVAAVGLRVAPATASAGVRARTFVRAAISAKRPYAGQEVQMAVQS
jgi:hypothetical protein